MVVHKAGGLVARVQFPAARIKHIANSNKRRNLVYLLLNKGIEGYSKNVKQFTFLETQALRE